MNRNFQSGEWAMPIDLAQEVDFDLGRIRVRPSSCEVEAGEILAVEPRVMQALVALYQRRGAVVSRDHLVQRCWSGRVVGDDAINRCIAKVRKLAEVDAGGSFEITTIPRVGYRLTESRAALEAPTLPELDESDAPAEPPAPSEPISRRRDWFIAGSIVLVRHIVDVPLHHLGNVG
jgi:DNA-binding winged helix-turn-helix (wHTH) protein